MMYRHHLVQILACVVIFLSDLSDTQSIDYELPDILKVCYRDDVDVNECLKESIQNALKRLPGGIPKLGLKPLDPYVEKEMKIEYNKNQITGKTVLQNVRVEGLCRAKVHAVRSNIQDDVFELEMDMTNKRIFVDGTMKYGEGRLNALVLRSQGYFNNTMRDVEWTWKLNGRPEVKDGKVYMRIVKFFMRPEVGSMKVHIPPVSDDPELNKIAYDWSNNLWRLAYRELLPIIELTWDKVGKTASNKIFLKIPYDVIFPTSNK